MHYVPTVTPPPPVSLHIARWAADIAADVAASRRKILLTALSCLPPRPTQTGDLRTLFAALAAAARRGVSVAVTLPAPTRTHPATARNYTAQQWFEANGIPCALLPLPGLLHAKTCQIDESILWVGSGNLTQAAATYNREAWIRTTHPATVAAYLGFPGRYK